AAGNRQDECELRPVTARRRQGELHAGPHRRERLFRARTGARYRARPDPGWTPLRGDPQQRPAARVPCRTDEPVSGGASLSVSPPTRPLRLEDDHAVGAAHSVDRRIAYVLP